MVWVSQGALHHIVERWRDEAKAPSPSFLLQASGQVEVVDDINIGIVYSEECEKVAEELFGGVSVAHGTLICCRRDAFL